MSLDEKFERYVTDELAPVYGLPEPEQHDDVEGMTFGVFISVSLGLVTGALLVIGIAIWVATR